MDYSVIIDEIKKSYQDQPLMAICDKIASILNINSKTVYNKMVERSHFSVVEVIKISAHLGISLDSIIHKDAKVNKPYTFYNRGEHYKPRAFSEYIYNLFHFFEPLVKHKEEVLSVYISRELSIFHLFHFPRLLYFKLFMWNKLNWNSINVEQYDAEQWIQSEHTKKSINHFIMYYSQLDETEIWSKQLFTTLLNQIENAFEYGIITKHDDLRSLYHELEKCINYLEKILQDGHKINAINEQGASISIYLNDLIVCPEMIHIQKGDQHTNYIMVNTPNFIECKDQVFCKSMEKFIQNIQDHAFAISRANKLKRDKLMQLIRNQIDASRKKTLE